MREVFFIFLKSQMRIVGLQLWPPAADKYRVVPETRSPDERPLSAVSLVWQPGVNAMATHQGIFFGLPLVVL